MERFFPLSYVISRIGLNQNLMSLGFRHCYIGPSLTYAFYNATKHVLVHDYGFDSLFWYQYVVIFINSMGFN